jgi:hypothetical protein
VHSVNCSYIEDNYFITAKEKKTIFFFSTLFKF